jgi:hypothetical protein
MTFLIQHIFNTYTTDSRYVGHDDKFHTFYLTHHFAGIRAHIFCTLDNLIYRVTELARRTLYTPMRTLPECMQQLRLTLSITTSDLILYISKYYL